MEVVTHHHLNIQQRQSEPTPVGYAELGSLVAGIFLRKSSARPSHLRPGSRSSSCTGWERYRLPTSRRRGNKDRYFLLPLRRSEGTLQPRFQGTDAVQLGCSLRCYAVSRQELASSDSVSGDLSDWRQPRDPRSENAAVQECSCIHSGFSILNCSETEQNHCNLISTSACYAIGEAITQNTAVSTIGQKPRHPGPAWALKRIRSIDGVAGS